MPVQCICPTCGRAYRAKPVDVRRGRAKSCSVKCSKGSPQSRFMAKVDQNGPVPDHRLDLGPCWIWIGARNKVGYGKVRIDGRDHTAHRIAYQWWVGSIPSGKQLDHLCRLTSCVNPSHLEPVSPRENTLRGQSPTVLLHHAGVCIRGHVVDSSNSYVRKGGQLHCRICVAERSRARRARLSA